MIMKLFRMRREYREWKADPADKIAETGLDVMSAFLKLPIIILSLIAVPSLLLFVFFGYKGFLVLAILAGIPLAIWIWISVSISRFAKKVTRVTTERVTKTFTNTQSSRVIDVDATEV